MHGEPTRTPLRDPSEESLEDPKNKDEDTSSDEETAQGTPGRSIDDTSKKPDPKQPQDANRKLGKIPKPEMTTCKIGRKRESGLPLKTKTVGETVTQTHGIV